MYPYLTLFLGGTVGKSTWRSTLIPMLCESGISYYNPVVDNWTPACIDQENLIKNSLDTVELYVITKDMSGVYSIAEMVDASNKKPTRTIVYIVSDGFEDHIKKSLSATEALVEKNGAHVAKSFSDVVSIFKMLERKQVCSNIMDRFMREKAI